MGIGMFSKASRFLRAGGMLFCLYSLQSYAATPELSEIEPEPIHYEKGIGEKIITEKLKIKDDDSWFLRSASITIILGYNASEDRLKIKNQGGILDDWNPETGTLTLIGLSSVSKYETMLRSIVYENANDNNPSTETRTIRFIVSDGSNPSNAVSRNIEMGLPNKAPVLSAIETTPLNFCNSGSLTITQTIAISDENDDLLNRAEIRISEGYRSEDVLRFSNTNGISGSWDAITGSLRLNGESSVNNYQVALRSIRYDNTGEPGNTGTRSVTFIVSDHRNESNPVSRNLEVVSAPEVRISGLAEVFNKQSTTLVPLNGTPTGGEFSGPGVVQYETGWFLIPSLPEVGKHQIIYKYENGSCAGYDTAAIEILSVGAFIEFENNRKKYCHSDMPFEVLGINLLGDSPGKFTITGGIGLTDHGNNKATVNPTQLNPGIYTITYSASGNIPVTADFEVGASMIADFSWDKACFQEGSSVTLSDRTASPFGILTDTSYYWKVHNGSSTAEFHTSTIQYKFPAVGHYAVELFIENSLGCADSIRKIVPLNEIIALAGNTYFEDFESGDNDWNKGTELQTSKNSWTLGDPDQGFSAPYSGIKAWYTRISPSNIPPEKSWVSSPCFDFRGTSQILVSARIWRLFGGDKDGVSLQASIDNGKTWNAVGTVFSGLNWYNDKFSSAQLAGWTNINDAGWIEARHSLDNLAGKTPVQFRFLYNASGTATGNYGIAFDDFKIGRRNHKSLIEHFTNTSNMSSFSADSSIDHFATKNSTSIIDLQYHTSTPANDPFYDDNPVIPSTRQLYYGVNSVPYALINGGSRADQRFDFLTGIPDLNSGLAETLSDSKFDMQVHSMISGDTFHVKTMVRALQIIPAGDLAVRIAIYEPLINTVTGTNGDKSFRNVVKTMLPGAAGISITQSWNKSDSIVILESWIMKNVYFPQDIKAAAFIQDESTHEIYQAASDVRGIFTGNVDPVERPGSGTRVYPNPASQSFMLLFKENQNETTVHMFNSMGRLVRALQMPDGTTQTEMNIEELPVGVYLLRVQEEGIPPENIKVIIAR